VKLKRTTDAGSNVTQEWYCFKTFEKQFFYYNIPWWKNFWNYSTFWNIFQQNFSIL